MPAVVDLLRTIAMLFFALGAPKRMMARVRELDREMLWRLANNLEGMRNRGKCFRWRGDSLAAVTARVELVIWVSIDPVKALRHMTRRLRGWKRGRDAAYAPLSFTPVRLWLAPSPTLGARVAFADSS